MRVEREETRAEIARRRLAQLAASFDAELPPPDDEPAIERQRRRLEVPHVRVLATLSTAASVLLVWWLLSSRPETSEPQAPLAFATTEAASHQKPIDDLVIDVVGKVRKPGIVTVPTGSRVYEAIEAAGGLKGRVDTSALNMARVLSDGEQLLVGQDPAEVPAAAAAPGGLTTTKVNLNTATAEQLDTLPGVGPVTAQSILSWRTENGRFGSVEDLLEVKGIGDATLAELRDLVTV
ncbi:competence protein ComEA [Aeromicrobium panaciterrae]|uniref:Competence protein ComEA n=1 Tax=Aeromicrobium panaciterrae TaxID=363861 RepID=A0ABU1UMZ8_9ACTN|nr:helix-hairpin-helix domain-containing protein [Aeromicrobium panaciterrae]MDR7086553.1 competence protein ComEA [Aeromicrobium panaciterrae]